MSVGGLNELKIFYRVKRGLITLNIDINDEV